MKSKKGQIQWPYIIKALLFSAVLLLVLIGIWMLTPIGKDVIGGIFNSWRLG